MPEPSVRHQGRAGKASVGKASAAPALEAKVWTAIRFECPAADCEFGSCSYEGPVSTDPYLAQPVTCDACGRVWQVKLVCIDPISPPDRQKLVAKP